MADVGQRVVLDLRNDDVPPHPRASRRRSSRRGAPGSCCRGSPTTSARSSRRCRRRSATCCASRWRSSASPALLFYYDARPGAGVPDRARRSSCIRSSGSGSALRQTTRRSQEHLEHMSHVSDRGVHRATASSRRSAPRTARPSGSARAARALYRANMKVTAALSMHAAGDGAARRRRAWRRRCGTAAARSRAAG